jgi:hypothetical protein
MKGGNLNNFKIIIVVYLVLTGFIIYKIYKYGFAGYAKRRMEKRQIRVDKLKNYVGDLQYN